jgi:hypothetical protein
MRISRLSTLVSAAILSLVLCIAGELHAQPQTSSITFNFPQSIVEPPDDRTLARYRQRPGYFRCELVRFDGTGLRDMILSVDSGVYAVRNTSLNVKVFGRPEVRFHGTSYEVSRTGTEAGPFVWTGMMGSDPYFMATFVLSSIGGIKLGVIHTANQVYRLSPSASSKDAFLCEVDPTRVPTKID